MKNEQEVVEIPVSFLTELLNIRREHNVVCDMFRIPKERRSEQWVGKGITERIRTYITSYTVRRSTVEKETGAAFREELVEAIHDPEVSQ